jgi:hypothetical protein
MAGIRYAMDGMGCRCAARKTPSAQALQAPLRGLLRTKIDAFKMIGVFLKNLLHLAAQIIITKVQTYFRL